MLKYSLSRQSFLHMNTMFTSWSNIKVSEEVKVEAEAEPKSLLTYYYACTIKAKHPYFIGCKTLKTISREISRYVYFFIKEENGNFLVN